MATAAVAPGTRLPSQPRRRGSAAAVTITPETAAAAAAMTAVAAEEMAAVTKRVVAGQRQRGQRAGCAAAAAIAGGPRDVCQVWAGALELRVCPVILLSYLRCSRGWDVFRCAFSQLVLVIRK